MHPLRAALLCGLLALGAAAPAAARTVNATPSDYKSKLGQLMPGDELVLAAGTYTQGLTIDGLRGTAQAPITIRGPASGAPAVIDARSCCNTVELIDSSYLVVRDLRLDGKDMAGIAAVSAKDGSNNLTHHITIEGLEIVGHGGSQQTVAISTKTPTWGWVIRGNVIRAAGTGMYLGNSNGAEPFIGGLIEGNLIENPTGYCIQIKHQDARPARPGMPTAPTTTILRHNVLIKDTRPSPDGARPNLLLGGFPQSGDGKDDRYEVYGNLIVFNDRDSLIQAEGRVSIHDNVLVDVAGAAITLRDHNKTLELAHVYNNTIYAAGTGINFGSQARQGHAVVGNLIFATEGIKGSVTTQSGNQTYAVSAASQHVTSPSKTLGQMDFYPLAGQAQGAALDLSAFSADVDFDRDFNGSAKGARTTRGAYTGGAASNPGWKLATTRKPLPGAPPLPGDAPIASGDGPVAGDSSTDAGAADGSILPSDARPGDDTHGATAGADDGGCCSVGATTPPPAALLLTLALIGVTLRRRTIRNRKANKPQ